MGASIRSFKNVNATDSKLLNAAKVEFGAAVLPAHIICKMFLENERSQGVKSNRKHRCREQQRKVKNHHFHVRKQEKNIHQFKYKLPSKFPGEKRSLFMEMHHLYCHPELPVGTVAVRRIPCSCVACDRTI